jgi:hypothetical protein
MNASYPAQCPECGEDAVHRSATNLVPWEAHGMERPGWSHRDGSSLCPVPARPVDSSPPNRSPGPPIAEPRGQVRSAIARQARDNQS